MERTERVVCYEDGRVVLVGADLAGSQVLGQGDTLELFEGGRFQPVEVRSGGYRGWFYLTAAGRPGRFAVGMRARHQKGW